MKLRMHVKRFSFIKSDIHGGKKLLIQRMVTTISLFIRCISDELHLTTKTNFEYGQTQHIQTLDYEDLREKEQMKRRKA